MSENRPDITVWLCQSEYDLKAIKIAEWVIDFVRGKILAWG